jgi:hypothetical protein
MHRHIGLLADVASAFLVERGAIAREILGLGRLEPERRIFGGAALDAQARRREHFPIMLLRRLAFGAPKRLRHLHEILPFRLRDEACERQQLAALILGEAREVRAISLYGAQYAHAGEYVVVGEGRVGSHCSARWYGYYDCPPRGVKVNFWPEIVAAYISPPLAMVNTAMPLW